MPSRPEPSFATSGSARLAWEATGDGDPVLCLHAGVNDRRSWDPLVDVLAPAHRCIRYDRRGYGDTTYEPEAHRPVDDALAVLDAAGVERAALVGASMGGFVAADLAAEHPDRVRALVLIGAPVRGGPWPEVADEATDRLDEAEVAAEAAARLDEANRWAAWHWLDGPSAPEGRVEGPVRDLFLDMNRRALTAPAPGEETDLASTWDRLPGLGIPTLALVGDLDERALQAFTAAVADHVPSARFELLGGTAHLPHLEGHGRCLEAIAEFLRI